MGVVEKRNCGDCGAKPGEFHMPGCDMEKCPLCGGQSIADRCIYELSGIVYATMPETHPEIYGSGPTEEMYVRYDGEIAKFGGRLPWDGEYHGSQACRDLGFYCYWGDPVSKAALPDAFVRGGKWLTCDASHPAARPDLNRLHREAYWCREQRRWVSKTMS